MHSKPAAFSVTEKNEMQQQFIVWNAERLAISTEESEDRFQRSLRVLQGGHSGASYRELNVHAHELLQVLYPDNPDDIYEAYRYFAPYHFLRMLAVPEPRWTDEEPLIREIRGMKQCRILDYGCGLAQKALALASYQRNRGVAVSLYLADIDTLRRGFLEWLCRKKEIDMYFLSCSQKTPVPELPKVDVIIAREIFEHIYDPLGLFNALDGVLVPGGVLLTNIRDHRDEFLHVSPNLEKLRNQIQLAAYEELISFKLYRKPICSEHAELDR
jgi:SAM-dependent methyltransferase